MAQSKQFCVLYALSALALAFPVSLKGSSVLLWDAETDPSVAGYKVYVGAASRTYSRVIDVGLRTGHNLGELDAAVTHYIAVTAYTADGLESPFSEEIVYTQPIKSTPANLPAATTFKRGSAVLHYMTRTTLSPADIASNTTASLRLQFNQQGGASLQNFDFTAANLDPSAQYFLAVATADDTNLVPVGTFIPNARGKVHLAYMKRGNGNSNSKKALPTAFDPVTDIHAIAIQNAATQTVASASISDSSNYQYLVKRNLTPADSNAPPAGWISLKANALAVNFRLLASGLNVSNTYSLVLNSIPVETVSSDANGAIQITNWPSNALPVLDLRSLWLLDGSGNVVLGTTLPK